MSIRVWDVPYAYGINTRMVQNSHMSVDPSSLNYVPYLVSAFGNAWIICCHVLLAVRDLGEGAAQLIIMYFKLSLINCCGIEQSVAN